MLKVLESFYLAISYIQVLNIMFFESSLQLVWLVEVIFLEISIRFAHFFYYKN